MRDCMKFVRDCQPRHLWFDVILWTLLGSGVRLAFGERPASSPPIPLIPYEEPRHLEGVSQRHAEMQKIIKNDKETVFENERDAATAKFAHQLTANGEFSWRGRNTTAYKLQKSEASGGGDDEFSGSAERPFYKPSEDDENPGAWPFRSARVSRVRDEDLRNESEGNVKDYVDNPHGDVKADYHGPWFSAARAQKQELEFGVKRLKNASRYMSWNAEDAYRRLENLNKMVSGFDTTDIHGHRTALGIKDALKQSNLYVDRIAKQTPQDIEQMGELANSYLDIPVLGEQVSSDKDVHIPHLKPVDEVTLKDKEGLRVRFYRQDKDGRCGIYKDVTMAKPEETLIRGACKSEDPVKKAKWGDQDGEKLPQLKFKYLAFKEDKITPTEVEVGDDACGLHKFPLDGSIPENTADKVLSLVDLGRKCERDSGKEAFNLKEDAFTVSGEPTLATPLIDEKNPLKKQLGGVTPYKYYNYLLKEGPGREELDHRLALPPELSGVPS